MNEYAIYSWCANGIVGLLMFFLKLELSNYKDKIKGLETDLKEIRDTAYKKEDFKDFREELWRRLDKFEEKVEARINK